MSSMAGPGAIQTFVPMRLFGQNRLVAVSLTGDTKDLAQQQEEEARRLGASKRRLYYTGEQLSDENLECAQALRIDPRVKRIPETMRLHAYSTQIGECIDYLADRIGEGWNIEADDDRVNQVIEDAIKSSPQLSAEDEDGNIVPVTDDALRDAMQTGDVAAYVAWDPISRVAVIELWESENVEFRYENTLEVSKVIRTETIWANRPGLGVVQVVERKEYALAPNVAGYLECFVTTIWDNDDEPQGPPQGLGIGRLPWQLLRCEAKGLRDTRGQSPISEQVMEAVDRFNAVQQLAFRIARYNSHGNLGVVGDNALLKVEAEGHVSKDVADVLTFPGGTSLVALSLPTDPQMINQQAGELKDEIVGAFGLVRVDPDTWGGLGTVSGYALEILNTRSESTFKRIRRQWRKDWTALLNLLLDIAAWGEEAQTAYVDPVTQQLVDIALPEFDEIRQVQPPVLIPDGATLLTKWWEVTPNQVFPNRTLKLTMGTGYIVDEVMIREDFSTGLISHEEALRQRGYSDKDIKQILKEIDDRKAKDAEAEAKTFQQAAALAAKTAGLIPEAPPSTTPTANGTTTQAGSTVGDTTGQQTTPPAAS
jgi:hypothetical protein